MLGYPKPKYRSPLRKWAGKRYFILKRYLKWYRSDLKFTSYQAPQLLEYCHFKHQSLILRKLKDVDMYLQHNKRTNLSIAIKKLNHILLKPGETFSFWYLVGPTYKWKGYKEGLMLDNGQIKKGIGGGLCQLGNLIFWIALHSPLEVTERWRHSYDVFPDANRKVPFGSGATLSYNYVDLQLTNTTNHNFQFHFWLDDTHLNGELRCNMPVAKTYKVEERNHIIRAESWGGYTRHNQIFQLIYDAQTEEQLEERLVIENHAIMMYRPFLESGTT